LKTTRIYSFAVCGSILFAGTMGGGIYRSIDKGEHWLPFNNGLTNLGILSFCVGETGLFAGTYGGGVFRSADSGAHWIEMNDGLTNTDIRSFAKAGTNVFTGSYGSGVFLLKDTTWTAVNTGLTNTNLLAIATNGVNLFAGALNGGVWRLPIQSVAIHDLPACKTAGTGGGSILQVSSAENAVYFTLQKEYSVSIRLYNMHGSLVAVLHSGRLSTGNHRIAINRIQFSRGVYSLYFKAGDMVVNKKLFLL